MLVGDSFYIVPQMGQLFFGSFSTTRGKIIITDQPCFQLSGTLADGLAILAKFLAGTSLSAPPQNLDHSGQIHPFGVPLELFGGFDVHFFFGCTYLQLGLLLFRIIPAYQILPGILNFGVA